MAIDDFSTFLNKVNDYARRNHLVLLNPSVARRLEVSGFSIRLRYTPNTDYESLGMAICRELKCKYENYTTHGDNVIIWTRQN